MLRSIANRRPSPSMVIASLALTIALGATSYAAVKLPAGSVGTRQLRQNAVTGVKVKNFSLSTSDFAPGQIPKGPSGPAGATGPGGPAGPAGHIGPSGIVSEPFAGGFDGPLPGRAPQPFTKAQGTSDLVIEVSGSGWVTSPNEDAHIALLVDNAPVGTTQMHFNISNQHLTLPTIQAVVKGLGAGPHSFELVPSAAPFTTDFNDHFRVTILEATPSG